MDGRKDPRGLLLTEELHRLIDNGANQSVINERIAGLLERQRFDIERIGSDHEKRIRFLERAVNYALGATALLTLVFEVVKMVSK